MDNRHVERLRCARDLLAGRGFDTRDAKLTCYSGAGFDDGLASDSATDVVLVPLDRLYAEP
jgi:hypothetical protein